MQDKFTTAGHSQPCRERIIFQVYKYTYQKYAAYGIGCPLIMRSVTSFLTATNSEIMHTKLLVDVIPNSLSIISNQNHKFVNSFRFGGKTASDTGPMAVDCYFAKSDNLYDHNHQGAWVMQ